MGPRACQDSHEYDRGSHDPGDEHRTSCSWSGGGDSTITTSNRQRESWTKTALGHEKNYEGAPRVRREHEVNRSGGCADAPADDCATARASKGTDRVKRADPQRVKEQSQPQADQSKETKEHSQLQAKDRSRRMVKSIPNRRDSLARSQDSERT